MFVAKDEQGLTQPRKPGVVTAGVTPKVNARPDCEGVQTPEARKPLVEQVQVIVASFKGSAGIFTAQVAVPSQAPFEHGS